MSTLERLASALANRYRIERELGAGGMATVYLAYDLKHDRRVALKVLKPELAAVLGADRFVIEIKTTAALQHPHILPLFDSGEADGFLFYVMPFIDGETLRSKLDRDTQLGIDEAVRIATNVADALDYAHRHGVIHRDIKPENILLHEGRPMVADFGIALAVSAAAGGRMTETGLSLGTPHYMSPEQATAEKEISARSDVYSLASVLYEMLAGDPPHTGSSAQQIIMKIITEEPADVTSLRKSVPSNVAAAVGQALEKLPADRFDSAAAFAQALSNPAFTFGATSGAAAMSHGSWRHRTAVPLGILALVLLSTTGWFATRRQPAPAVMRLDLTLGAATPTPSSDVVISPDGSTLAFVGASGDEQPAVHVRRLDGEPGFRKLVGSEGALATPGFSPNSRSIAFRRQTDGTLLRMDIAGGGVTTIARLGTELGTYLHWGTPDHIVYSGGPRGLYRVAAGGGTPEFLEKTALAARYSFLLPDGSGVLFHRGAGIFVLTFDTDSATLLIPDALHPVYSESGHILYIAESGGLSAVPFDLAGHRITGPPVLVQDGIASAVGQRGFSVSRNGILVYREGASDLTSGAAIRNRLVMFTIGGGADTLRLPPGNRTTPRFSPDGRQVAFEVWANRDDETDIHTFELATGTNTQLTFAGNNRSPIWSPDSRRIAFSRLVAPNDRDIFVSPADNSAPEGMLTSPGVQVPNAWPDGDTILLTSGAPGLSPGIFRYSLKAGGAPTAYIQESWPETEIQISPDGSLAAVTSQERGGTDVWLRDYPGAQEKRLVSPDGGYAPRWSRDGVYIYFWKSVSVAGDSLFRSRVDRMPSVVVRAPELVNVLPVLGVNRSWDLHPDGNRFILVTRDLTPTDGAASSRYVVALNWFTQLQRLTQEVVRE